MDGERIFFRAEASSDIGYGHLKRCLQIASFVKSAGKHPVFITSKPEQIEGKFEVFEIPEDISYIEEIEHYPDDVQNIVLDLSHRQNLDHPPNLKAYVDALVARGVQVVFMDGLLGEAFYATNALKGATAVVQPYLGAEKGLSPDTENWLTGGEYAVMPDAYKERTPRQINPVVENILLTFGGADPKGITAEAMRAVSKISKNVNIRVIVGPYFSAQHKAEIENVALRFSGLFEVLLPQKCMIEQYEWAEIALSASGLSRYEMASMGVPFIFTAPYADHDEGSHAFVGEGMAVYLGVHGKFDPSEWRKNLESLIGDQEKRQSMSLAGQRTIDGKGAMRITQKLLEIFS